MTIGHQQERVGDALAQQQGEKYVTTTTETEGQPLDYL